MDIKPETVKKLAYPALAVVAAAAFSSCDRQPPEDIDQGIPGEPPAYSGRIQSEDIDQGIPGEPPAYSGRIQSEE